MTASGEGNLKILKEIVSSEKTKCLFFSSPFLNSHYAMHGNTTNFLQVESPTDQGKKQLGLLMSFNQSLTYRKEWSKKGFHHMKINIYHSLIDAAALKGTTTFFFKRKRGNFLCSLLEQRFQRRVASSKLSSLKWIKAQMSCICI